MEFQTPFNVIKGFVYFQLKSSKQCLRQLHMTVQSAESQAANPQQQIQPAGTPLSSHFQWLSTRMLTGLAYVLTVLANIQYSNYERAIRYYGTALQHFDALKALMRKSSWAVVEHNHEEMIGEWCEEFLWEIFNFLDQFRSIEFISGKF